MYRTKVQLHVISRFIETVATSFCSNTDLHQHLIFSGTRDGSHLAEQAIRHWPPQGTHGTQVHLIAVDSEEGEGDDPLKYDLLNEIEDRFRGNKEAHIYDRNGMAGNTADDDEEELDSADLRDMLAKNDEKCSVFTIIKISPV